MKRLKPKGSCLFLAWMLLLSLTTSVAVAEVHIASAPGLSSSKRETRLVLQVHVEDAVNLTLDRALDRIRQEFGSTNIHADVEKKNQAGSAEFRCPETLRLVIRFVAADPRISRCTRDKH